MDRICICIKKVQGQSLARSVKKFEMPVPSNPLPGGSRDWLKFKFNTTGKLEGTSELSLVNPKFQWLFWHISMWNSSFVAESLGWIEQTVHSLVICKGELWVNSSSCSRHHFLRSDLAHQNWRRLHGHSCCTLGKWSYYPLMVVGFLDSLWLGSNSFGQGRANSPTYGVTALLARVTGYWALRFFWSAIHTPVPQ